MELRREHCSLAYCSRSAEFGRDRKDPGLANLLLSIVGDWQRSGRVLKFSPENRALPLSIDAEHRPQQQGRYEGYDRRGGGPVTCWLGAGRHRKQHPTRRRHDKRTERNRGQTLLVAARPALLRCHTTRPGSPVGRPHLPRRGAAFDSASRPEEALQPNPGQSAAPPWAGMQQRPHRPKRARQQV